MSENFIRTEKLFGKEAMEKLEKSHVAIFGIGGVGGYCTEALIRSAIGKLDLIDSDKITQSNINRQIIALNSTVNSYKVDVMEQRAIDINENVKIKTYKTFFDENTVSEFDFTKYNYVIDAIDSIKSKILLIKTCNEYNIPIISSMGMGNKINPSLIEVEDIYKTSVCPLARIIRQELKKAGIKKLKTVYSKENPIKINPPTSCAFVPSVAGLIMASEVIKDLILN